MAHSHHLHHLAHYIQSILIRLRTWWPMTGTSYPMQSTGVRCRRLHGVRFIHQGEQEKPTTEIVARINSLPAHHTRRSNCFALQPICIWFMLKMVGTSRDSRDMAYLLGLRCPDFFKCSRDSRDKLCIAVHRRIANRASAYTGRFEAT